MTMTAALIAGVGARRARAGRTQQQCRPDDAREPWARPPRRLRANGGAMLLAQVLAAAASAGRGDEAAAAACSLNGVQRRSDGAASCVCDTGWTGAACEALDLVPPCAPLLPLPDPNPRPQPLVASQERGGAGLPAAGLAGQHHLVGRLRAARPRRRRRRRRVPHVPGGDGGRLRHGDLDDELHHPARGLVLRPGGAVPAAGGDHAAVRPQPNRDPRPGRHLPHLPHRLRHAGRQPLRRLHRRLHEPELPRPGRGGGV